MALIKFIHKGLLTTVQDNGRKGLAYYAIPPSGAMDSFSSKKANLLIGNSIDNPVFECHLRAPEILFDFETSIAITGADMQWKINGSACKMNYKLDIHPGDILSGSHSIDALRSYIAINGIPKSQKSYGSYSIYPFAGLGANHGKNIESGDKLLWETKNNDHSEASFEIDFERSSNHDIMPLKRGPEYHLLDNDSKDLLTTSNFTITSQSNRMGARLHGPALKSTSQLIESRAILPGFIQLLPSGQLIVVLQDGQTTGGYPRIAWMDAETLNDFNQIMFNKPFQWRLK